MNIMSAVLTNRRLWRGCLERQPVRAEAIVVDIGEVARSPGAIRDYHTASDEKIDLPIDRKRGLVVSHGKPPKSNPPGALIRPRPAEARRVLFSVSD